VFPVGTSYRARCYTDTTVRLESGPCRIEDRSIRIEYRLPSSVGATKQHPYGQRFLSPYPPPIEYMFYFLEKGVRGT
jgi:hypothetical protein